MQLSEYELVLKPYYQSETKYSSKNEMYCTVITMKICCLKLSLKIRTRSSFISLNGEIIIKNTEFGNLHGSKHAPFFCILNADYSDIGKGE